MKTEEESIRELTLIPGVGKSIAADLRSIGVHSIADLRGEDPEELYDRLNSQSAATQDRCVLYVFRCAVYYADTPASERDSEKLKWWNWKDDTHPGHRRDPHGRTRSGP